VEVREEGEAGRGEEEARCGEDGGFY
jgi:hypothetical protein